MKKFSDKYMVINELLRGKKLGLSEKELKKTFRIENLKMMIISNARENDHVKKIKTRNSQYDERVIKK